MREKEGTLPYLLEKLRIKQQADISLLPPVTGKKRRRAHTRSGLQMLVLLVLVVGFLLIQVLQVMAQQE
jgi:hypothetical protein